jgi:hypothetical protein
LLGYSPEQLDDVNRRAVGLLDELRGDAAKVMISGCVGPRGDGYVAGELMSADEAEPTTRARSGRSPRATPIS